MPAPAKHYKLHPLNLKHWPRASVTIARAAIRNLQDTLDLLNTPHVWIQGDYGQEDNLVATGKLNRQDKPVEVVIPWQGCLVGAMDKVNGKGQILAAEIAAQVLTGKLMFDDDTIPTSAQQNELEDTGSVEYYFFNGTRDAGVVESFNDNSNTTLADIRKFLKYAIRQAERVVEHARAGNGFKVRA